VVPFGATGAPSTFQGAMNSTLAPLLRRCTLVFFDDILVYSSSYAKHLEHLHQVLSFGLGPVGRQAQEMPVCSIGDSVSRSYPEFSRG
jgi:hypothetical protein